MCGCVVFLFCFFEGGGEGVFRVWGWEELDEMVSKIENLGGL